MITIIFKLFIYADKNWRAYTNIKIQVAVLGRGKSWAIIAYFLKIL